MQITWWSAGDEGAKEADTGAVHRQQRGEEEDRDDDEEGAGLTASECSMPQLHHILFYI